MTLAPKQKGYLVRPLYPEVLFGGSRRHTTPREFQTDLSAQTFRSTCYENQLYFNTLSDLTLLLRVLRCRAGPVEGRGFPPCLARRILQCAFLAQFSSLFTSRWEMDGSGWERNI